MEIQSNTKTNAVEVKDTYTPFQVTPKDFKDAFGDSCGPIFKMFLVNHVVLVK